MSSPRLGRSCASTEYTVPIVSQVRGRVLEVPIEEGNRPVHKGDVLFRIDPLPYQLEVNNLQAQLATAQAGQRELVESQKGANAKTTETQAAILQATIKDCRSYSPTGTGPQACRAEPRAGRVRAQAIASTSNRRKRP